MDVDINFCLFDYYLHHNLFFIFSNDQNKRLKIEVIVKTYFDFMRTI